MLHRIALARPWLKREIPFLHQDLIDRLLHILLGLKENAGIIRVTENETAEVPKVFATHRTSLDAYQSAQLQPHDTVSSSASP